MVEPARVILYGRDADGVPYAIETVAAERWDPALAAPPDAEVADVRVVHLARGPLPASTPPWLRVRLDAPAAGSAAGRRVAEAGAVYAVAGDEATEPEAGALWTWSPHHRRPAPPLDEFLRAGAAALRHPDAPPVDPARQHEALSAFARGRDLALLGLLRSTALERWLHVRFGDPDAFAAAILIERIAGTSAEDAALLRFLRAARVPDGDPTLADIAIDRAVLLEEASPWRYFDAAPMAPALAALRGWQRRYRRAYAQRYREAVAGRGVLLTEAAEAESRLVALERLNGIAALGAPDGREALARLRGTVAALGAMPDAPDLDAPVTAGIVLGAPNPLARELRTAAAEAERALQSRLRRLAFALAGCALDRGGDDDLARVLAAIAASEVDRIDRVLDDRLAAHIERLLADLPPSPIARLARRFPEVTRANLDAAVEEFRRAAEQAIALSEDGRATLGPGAEEATYEV